MTDWLDFYLNLWLSILRFVRPLKSKLVEMIWLIILFDVQAEDDYFKLKVF